MSRRLKKLVSIWLLALLAFAHGNLVFAGCAMDRGDLARMLASPSSHDCCDEDRTQPMPVNGCVSLATDDLKAVGAAILVAAIPPLDAVLLVRAPLGRSLAPARAFPPPPAVPPRILLHSFLI